MLVLFPLVVVIYVVSNALINHKPSSKLRWHGFHVYIYINIIIQYVTQCICIYHALGLSFRNPWSWRMEIVLVHVWKILLAICGKATILTISTWFSAVGMSVYVWWRPPCGSILIKFLCFPIESPIDKFCWFMLVQSHKISMNPPWYFTFFLVNSPCFWWLASLCSFGHFHGRWMLFESPMTPMMLLVATVNLPCGIFRTTNGLKTSNDKIKWTTGGSINVQSGMPQ